MAGKITALVHSAHVANHPKHSSDLLMIDKHSDNRDVPYRIWAFLGALRRLVLYLGDEGCRKRT